MLIAEGAAPAGQVRQKAAVPIVNQVARARMGALQQLAVGQYRKVYRPRACRDGENVRPIEAEGRNEFVSLPRRGQGLAVFIAAD